MKFSHLHVHTQYSLLDGASSISSIYQKAMADEMPAIAISDHGNLFGAFEFLAEAAKHKNKVKPIVGCEFYIVEDAQKKESSSKQHHQLLLAKNEKGYQNLLHLAHFSYTQGFYRKPLIDKAILQNHHEGLIATSCCLAAMVPQALLRRGEEAAEEELKWWLSLFGDDYYLELQRHQLDAQDRLNAFLLKMAKKYNILTIATNDSHYTEQQDASMHEVLLCINTGSFMSDPPKRDEPTDADENLVVSKADGKKVKQRFAFPNDHFFFKKSEEMRQLFHDLPEAIDNTNHIVDKIDILQLKKDVLLPLFPLPEHFHSQHEYLRHLSMQGLQDRYTQITPEIEQRIQFELEVIEKMDYSGYFLIVSDFIKSVKELGVAVGPGRGSAAGSLVAYTTGITNIDPIKYNLLFERFLNPERRGMPDIDIDFDDVGRSKVIDYIVQRYGKDRTAQIITFNKMGARNAIKDVARVMEFPFSESNLLSQLANSRISIKRQLDAPLSNQDHSLEVKDGLSPQELEKVQQLRKRYHENEKEKNILDIAAKIDGSIRNVGVHAAGIIIAPQRVQDLIPVCTVKGNEMLVTQIEGKYIEDAGVIKMDILGLSNLNQIQTTLRLIEERHQKKIDIDHIPLDDEKTFELYQRGDTVGTFQFESDGMRKYLRDLKPDKFEDLIALNALYRPGPIKYIPKFIQRKHGKEKITYDLPIMQDILEETYGITVYQEQVMLLAQILANFSKGEADVLRKAMGKKQKSVLDKMKVQFMDGATANGHPKKEIEKIWTDWESFAEYAFNKSHSTCYAFVAYQTAYLKANYPHEFMTSLLEGAKDIKGLSKIIKETVKMNIPVLGPCVNESQIGFSITKNQHIRFGLSAIKGFGEQDGRTILSAREENNHAFTDIFHFMEATKGQLGTGKMESLVKSGSFDFFTSIKRPQYFAKTRGKAWIEELCNYGKAHANYKQEHQSPTLFDLSALPSKGITRPSIPPLDETTDWTQIDLLQKEKEVLGTYVSKHPLSLYAFEFDHFNFTSLQDIEKLMQEEDSEHPSEENTINRNTLLLVGGIVESVQQKITKKGKPYLSLTLSDFSNAYDFTFFGKDYATVKEFATTNAYIYFFLGQEKEYASSDRYKLAIKKVGLLENFLWQHSKELHLYLRSEQITPTITDFFSTQFRKNIPGKTKVFFHVKSKHIDNVSMYIERPITLSEDIADFLKSQPQILCKIVS